MDFTNFPRSGTYYGGSEKKIGIVIDDEEYMLKFQKKTPFGMRYNHLSEYIGCHIFEIADFSVQETFLGTYGSESVVACKNFIRADEQFVPFNDVGESTLDRDKELYQYDYDDIMQMLLDNSKLTNISETIDLFWEMYIMDALLGNFDRHGGNWGFIKRNNKYSLAPVFDNGSCLFPQMIDENLMHVIIGSEEETRKRVYSFPTSQIKHHGRKSSYYEIISSLEYPECNKALISVADRIKSNFDAMFEMIDDIKYISSIHKEFYKHMIRSRYELIIESSLRKMR
nr:HipA domain-containing protein [Butyrivibrio sp. WCD3002]